MKKKQPKLSPDEKAVRHLLEMIGENPDREGLRNTPGRVVRALHELTAGYKDDPKKILSTVFTQKYNEMVIVRDIEFWSLCEHHMLPFYGFVTIGYLPGKKIVGLSKLGRLVHCFARRLQVQERMTEEIADALMKNLHPLGVGVIVKAQHTCMRMRGVKSPGVMVTSCLLGEFRDPTTRSEFMALRAAQGGGSVSLT